VVDPQFDEVLDAARAGHDWAWALLFDDFSGPVLGYLRSQGVGEPEDMLSEVFLHLARGIGSFAGTASAFRSWVFTIAHSRIIDDRRRVRRHPVDPDDSVADKAPASHDVTSEAALESVQTEWVEDALHTLVPDQRDVLLLRIVSGLTIAEIAAIVGKTEGAVKALQRRGLSALRRSVDWGGIPR
jgi:RNA polymerase sigma-70 factor (ECF subfamily)